MICIHRYFLLFLSNFKFEVSVYSYAVERNNTERSLYLISLNDSILQNIAHYHNQDIDAATVKI